jgi:hypothetical protein
MLLLAKNFGVWGLVVGSNPHLTQFRCFRADIPSISLQMIA